MQTLEWQDRLKIDQAQMIEQEFLRQQIKHQKQYDVPQGYEGIKISVSDGENAVLLTVGDMTVSMTTQGAHDLAYRLRQSANRVGHTEHRKRHGKK